MWRRRQDYIRLRQQKLGPASPALSTGDSSGDWLVSVGGTAVLDSTDLRVRHSVFMLSREAPKEPDGRVNQPEGIVP
jgi:hypothetical protein